MDQTLISLEVLFSQIFEKSPPLPDELEETEAGMVILDMDLEVLREVLNPLAYQGNLYLRRTGIGRMDPILINDPLFLLLSDPHVFSVRFLSFFFIVLIVFIIVTPPSKPRTTYVRGFGACSRPAVSEATEIIPNSLGVISRNTLLASLSGSLINNSRCLPVPPHSLINGKNQVIPTTGFEPCGRPKGRAAASPPCGVMDRDSTGETPSVLCPRHAAGIQDNIV